MGCSHNTLAVKTSHPCPVLPHYHLFFFFFFFLVVFANFKLYVFVLLFFFVFWGGLDSCQVYVLPCFMFSSMVGLSKLTLAWCTANVAAPTGRDHVVSLRDRREKLCECVIWSQLNNERSSCTLSSLCQGISYCSASPANVTVVVYVYCI